MKKLLILLAIILTSCGVDNPSMNNYTVNQVGTTGLILEAPATDMWVDFSKVEKVYVDTEECMGLYADAPTVWFRDTTVIGIGSPWGVYLPNGKLVIINNNMPSPYKRSKKTDVEALRHEYIHHILTQNGMSEESRSHSSSMFELCGLGVNQYN